MRLKDKRVKDAVRGWIVEILEQNKPLLAIAIRQKAKFEGWLKFELAASAARHGAKSIEVESSYDDSPSHKRSDLSFIFKGIRYDIELKTPNSNWRIPGVRNSTRPITKNVASIISDAKKLCRTTRYGIVAFVLFPVPSKDDRWLEYIQRISTNLQTSITSKKNCARLTMPLGKNHAADVVVCTFLAPRRLVKTTE